jgi:hypothetical protein
MERNRELVSVGSRYYCGNSAVASLCVAKLIITDHPRIGLQKKIALLFLEYPALGIPAALAVKIFSNTIILSCFLFNNN